MPLIRQAWLLLVAAVLLVCAGSLGVVATSARDLLQLQQGLKNSEGAASLAWALSQQQGAAEPMSQLLAKRFDAGDYRRLRWIDAEGHVVFEREVTPLADPVPTWFSALLPVVAPAGMAQVMDGQRSSGRIEIESQLSPAQMALWASSVRAALILSGLGLLVAGLGLWWGRQIQRQFDAAIGQVRAIERGELATASEPPLLELRLLTQAMNLLVGRVRASSNAQAEQLADFHRKVHCDALTGLSNRTHFLVQFGAALQREDGPAEGGLVLLRVMDLGALNRQFGHTAADRILVTIAESLRPYADGIKGCFVGRLNGSDFALCLPAPGVADETAKAVADALRLVLPTLGNNAKVCLGAVELHRDMPPGRVISAADAALARAELRGAFAVELGSDPPEPLAVLGERVWRQRILQALDQQRVRLMEFPVLNARRQLVHLECPLRLQLDANGVFEPAARWLPLAARSRLTGAVDECALALALRAALHDGQARCVNLSPASLTDSGFASRMRALLWNAPQAARLIWLEVAESAAVEHVDLLRELGRQLRPTGVRFGIEHAGERLGHIPRLFEAGLDYVKLDASLTAGVGRDDHRALFVRGTVTLLHGLGIQVYAEGVADARDAGRLWECGIDGATGPWVSTLDIIAG